MADSDVVTTTKGKKKEPTVFGLYQLETGSYTLDEYRFRPNRPLEVPQTLTEKACEDTSPVKFFGSLEEANTAATKLKAKFDAKRKPQAKDED